ncbi:hypothetical protein AK812_SmicGene48995, partial [Symbiodinium microadriaticum]
MFVVVLLGRHELQGIVIGPLWLAAVESGKSSVILAIARDVLMEKLDKER